MTWLISEYDVVFVLLPTDVSVSMRSPTIIYGSTFYAQNCIRTGKQHDASAEFKGESDGPSLSAVGI